MDTDITDPSFKYAPSQNPIDPLNSSSATALPNTMAQQVDFVSSGSDFADNIRKQTRQLIDDQNNAMMLSMSKAAAGNAEEAAAAQRLGYETGVGAEIAARNKQLLEQRLATDRLAQLDLFRRDPVLARMLANKDFAAVAHDDLPNLMESGQQINPDLSWLNEFLIGRARGYKGTELGITGMDMLAAKARGVPIPESLRAKAAQQKQELAELRASGGFLESFGALEGNIESAIPKQAEMAVYGAVAGGLILGAPTGGIGLVPGMIAGAEMGLMSATVGQTFQIEGGNLFVDMLDDGIPEDTALVAAPIGGAIMAALEILPLKFVTGEAKKLIKREVAGQVIDTLKQTGMLDVTKRFLQSYGIGVTTEVGTELAQDAVSTYVQEMAMLATDPLYEEKWKSEKGRAELAKQFVDTFIEVGQGMAIMGAFLPGANFISDARRARKAKATRQFFKDIDKNASESKLKGRNPRTYQEWYEMKARGTANHTLFIDIEKLREAMAKNNVSAQQLETILPGVTKAIADAKGMNGIDFSFPTSVYAARLSDLAFGQALQEHMRFDPKDMSIADEIQYSKEEKQLVEEMKESAMELMKADAAVDQSAQAVTDLVTAQLVAAGKYTESEARSMASVASASATVMSARFNMTPLDWHNKYGAKVFGEGQVAPAAPLEQAAVPAPSIGVFDAKNPPVSSEPIFAVMNADGQIYYDVNATMHGDLAETFPDIADTTIDGGFIIDGKYKMGMSDRGYSAFEGTSEQVEQVKEFTKQANTVPQVLEQAAKADANAINEQAVQESDDTVATAESQPNIPTTIDDAISLDSVAKLATGRAWERGRDLKVEMQKEATTLASGSGVDLLIDTPQTTEYLTRVGLRDALYALRQNPNSVGWYDEKTRQALAVMALVHPEILTDENARFAFTWALAVTSNGIKVGKNFELAEMVYRRYKSDGKMPSDLAAGTSQEAINNSLSLFNTLRDAWGIDNLRRFAQTEYTIQELKYIVADTDSGGEYANTVVKGAAVLGPKIGNGFFSNLYGDFRSLTMDRWLVRTWGRWTGTLIMPMPVQTQNARTRLQTVITSLTQDERASMASILREAVPKQAAVIDAVEAGSGVDFDALSSVIQKASMDKEVRAKMNETFAGQEVRKAGNGLAKYLDGQKEAPAGPGERVRIRGIFTTILQQLQQLPEYAELTMADLQAALWYAEKRLYETAKEDITIDEEDIEGYADDEAPDYANAAADVARVAGVSNEKISQTLQRESNNERSRQSRLQEKSGSPVEARNTAATRGFSDNEKRQFNGAAVIRNDRASRSNIAGSPQPYTRSGSKTNTKPRLVTLLRARVVSLFQPQGRLRNALKAAGGEKRPFDTPKFYELEKSEKSPIAFHRLITESKSKSEFGASVYAYTVEEYADMRLFVSEDALSGFALKSDDIVSVFSMSDAAVGHALMQMAVSVGGRRLDAFDTVLPYLYAPHGFRAVARLRWDEGRKPEGWDKKTFAKFNNGEPDVVFMVYDPTYFGQYSNKDGKVAKSEDAAVRVQKKATSNIANGGILEQAMPSGPPRATIDLRTFFITLNTAADLTSYLHEMAHFYMATYVNIANEPGAPPQITADLQIIFDWLGIKDLAAWNAMTMEEQRKYWEAFGYNHEIYLFEGKSPSVEMQGVFDRFSAWLRKIYGNIRDELNVIYRREFGEDLPILTPEIRGVMDRILASEKQIKYAESVNNMTPLFLTQEQSGYDDARWAAYQAMVQEAHDQSVTDLTKASLRQMEWLSNARTRLLKEMQAKHDDIRDKMRSDIAEEVAAEPVYMAMSVLKTGKGRVANGEMVVFSDKYKLNLAIVKKMIPAENLSKLGYGKFGMLSEDGLHPDMVAEMFGFKSGDELVLALLAAKPVKEEVDSRLDARMLAEYGDMNTPAEMEVQVQKALHNEARERFIGVEARFVASATRPVRAMTDAARLAANTIVNAQKIENIRPSNYAAAEARAARDAADAYKQRQSPEQARKTSYTRSYNEQIAAGVDEATAVAEATKKGDQAAAAAKDRQDAFAAKYGNREPAQVVIRAKQAQVVQNQLVKVSTAALEEVDKALKDFRRFFKADEKIAKGRNMDLVDAARSILAFYGLGKHDKLPSAYTEKLQAYNPAMYEAVKPIIEMSQQAGAGGDHETLTVSEFRMMREVVDALWTQARRDQQAEIAGKMVSVAQIQAEFIARTEEIGIPADALGSKQALTENQKRIQHLMSTGAVLQRVENWARRFDGPQEPGTVGPATKYIWRPIKNAVTAYKIDKNKYVKKFVELLNKVDLPAGKFRSDELDYTFGVGNGGNGKAELLGAMLHIGNLSNLRKLLIGRGWGSLNADGTLDTSRWDAFVERMINEGKLTKEDFEFLQATWDLLEEIKPIAQKAHRDLYGYYFNEIEAKSFTNRFGTYRGGYVPAKTDAMIVRDAQRQAKTEELEADFRASMPSTGMGFTMGRVEYDKPLSIDLRLIEGHIDSVLRFSHIQPAVKDVLKIIGKGKFADNLTAIQPFAIDEVLLPWLNRTARQTTSVPGLIKWVDKSWNIIRKRTGIAIMMGGVRNAMQQFTGLFPAALLVKKGELKNAASTYFRNPMKTASYVASLSPFMNDHMNSQIFVLQDNMNELLINPSKYARFKDWMDHHAYFLQTANQNIVNIITWLGKYNQVLSEIDASISDSEAQAEAIQQADAAVRLTQGGMSPEDVARFQVGTPFFNSMTQFMGFFNMTANLNADEFVMVFRDLGWRGNKGKLMMIYILGIALPAIVSDAISRSLGQGWDDDDDGYLDDVADWFFGSQVRYVSAFVPFGSTALTAITSGFNDKTYDDRIGNSPSIASLEASSIGVGKAIVNIASDDKELEGRNVRDVLTLITNVTGVPVSVLGRPIGYQVDVARGKVEPTDPIDYMRGLITGVPSAESKKK